MSKMIDLNRSVFELVTEYPEIGDIMEKLGFREIRKPAMLHSVGKLMTLPRGARMKNIPMEKVIAALARKSRKHSPRRSRRAWRISRAICAVLARANLWRASGRISRKSSAMWRLPRSCRLSRS